MGVKGLWGYAREVAKVEEDVKFVDEVKRWKRDHGGDTGLLLADGNNLSFRLFPRWSPFWLGGSFLDARRYIDQFLDQVKATGIRLAIVMDTAMPADSRMTEWLARRRKDQSVLRRVVDALQTGRTAQLSRSDFVSPQGFLTCVRESFVRRPDVCELIDVLGDADSVIGHLCRTAPHKYMGVLSGDSDFLIFSGVAAIYSVSDMTWSQHGGRSSAWATARLDPLRLRRHLAGSSHLGRPLSQSSMELFASLLPGDFLPLNTLASRYRHWHRRRTFLIQSKEENPMEDADTENDLVEDEANPSQLLKGVENDDDYGDDDDLGSNGILEKNKNSSKNAVLDPNAVQIVEAVAWFVRSLGEEQVESLLGGSDDDEGLKRRLMETVRIKADAAALVSLALQFYRKPIVEERCLVHPMPDSLKALRVHLGVDFISFGGVGTMLSVPEHRTGFILERPGESIARTFRGLSSLRAGLLMGPEGLDRPTIICTLGEKLGEVEPPLDASVRDLLLEKLAPPLQPMYYRTHRVEGLAAFLHMLDMEDIAAFANFERLLELPTILLPIVALRYLWRMRCMPVLHIRALSSQLLLLTRRPPNPRALTAAAKRAAPTLDTLHSANLYLVLLAELDKLMMLFGRLVQSKMWEKFDGALFHSALLDLEKGTSPFGSDKPLIELHRQVDSFSTRLSPAYDVSFLVRAFFKASPKKKE